jgi:poly-gamma-glutamate capsule biosynthesis protein CapA/YwtB (metallophosphatase superfamily)
LSELVLLLCGDVMTGRGIDQILPHPGDPQIREPYVISATHYVRLAEAINGAIPKPVSFAYIWGEALAELAHIRPDARIINLETSITESRTLWPKGINYRMSPANIPCITAAEFDVCSLANNHVLDCRYPGLEETIDTLKHSHIACVGAGRDTAEAQAPAIKEIVDRGRVIVFGFGSVTSGISREWAAGPNRPGVNLLPDLSDRTADRIATQISSHKQPGDVVVASIHWGGNWGYRIASDDRSFAHRLIDAGAVDVVHGHSSHHAKAIEVYKGKLILYGCGDFLNDYEGIAGYEAYRDDLALMYLPTIEATTGDLVRLGIVPFQIKRFRLNRASPSDVTWIRDILSREGRSFGTRLDVMQGTTLELSWT